MKIVSFDDYRIGVLNDDGVVDVTDVVSEVPDKLKWARMLVFIEEWDSLRPKVEAAAKGGTSKPLS